MLNENKISKTFQAQAANIAEVATQAGFSTLVEFVVAAGLADTLSNGGPFTVFAPTNEAFAKLPPSTVQALKQDPELLKSVLLYHVVSGKVMARDLVDESIAPSVQGSTLRFNNYIRSKFYDGFWTVNGKRIRKTDIEADNGVIHVVSEVIFPFSDMTIPEVLTKDGRFSTLLTAVGEAGLVNLLSGEGPFTVFAPTDDAFAKIPANTLNAILGDKATLTAILTRHVVPRTIFAQGVHWEILKTASGDEIQTQLYKGGRAKVASAVDGTVTTAEVVDVDLLASNGVVHAIDTVI